MSLLQAEINGRATWRLLGPTGVPLMPFQIFADSIAKTRALNTRSGYCRYVAEFIDFVYEAAFALTRQASEPFTKLRLEQIVEAYDDYLVFGCDAPNPIARVVDRSKPSPKNSAQTSAVKHAAVREFLRLSEQTRRQTVDFVRLGLSSITVATTGLDIVAEIQHSNVQRPPIKASTMLSGVLGGALSAQPTVTLPALATGKPFDVSKAFPFDAIHPFIDHLPTNRDKALYSLFAAAGPRGHEGLQLLWSDIDVLTCWHSSDQFTLENGSLGG